ncbi:dihydroneopterin aldolase [Sphingomonas astaxanthinifaciens]|uniref:7,8-dihydroneopterin aldolase n=1 Tax=Sphingomonas astaxanthinifaciens DSM 22298 TaxID=1123267 RepID=A0ABQ5Z354_9SPHN|nr:dihydroneopterin aldolase [Sphingomonas astaxanthinifaciens]GLR46461.1 7,8-dihydroneopterin aldolase [Sphingomonas astaxanthinifaciens DSM 22298]
MSDIIPFTPRLDGLVPPALAVRSAKIFLEQLEVMADIGFHDFEIGTPQRLLITVEIWLTDCSVPADDAAESAWNYDHVKLEIERIAGARRFNLQETLIREIYDWIAARDGVRALRVASAKPDVYPNARSVGVEFASFSGSAP